jgi:S1-C subfamily serine protease
MNSKLKIVVGVIVLLTVTKFLMAEVHFTKLVRSIRPAAVTVVVYDANHQVSGSGSGFFIDKYGHLITNFKKATKRPPLMNSES